MKNEIYDLWSDGYRETVRQFNDNDEYPFAGTRASLDEVYRMVRQSHAKRILDIGFGTGIIAEKLDEDGYQITGVDPSKKMIAAGKEVCRRRSFWRRTTRSDCRLSWSTGI